MLMVELYSSFHIYSYRCALLASVIQSDSKLVTWFLSWSLPALPRYERSMRPVTQVVWGNRPSDRSTNFYAFRLVHFYTQRNTLDCKA
jgi:hypothetical protein